MSFPSIVGTPTLTQLTSANPASINLPSGIQAGELLLVFCAGDSSGTMSQSGGSDWTILDQGNYSSYVCQAIFAKIAEGGDSLSVQFEANDFAAVAIRVQNHGVSNVSTDIILGTAATGNNKTPNPPNCNPGVAKDYLWIEHFAADDDDNTANYQTSGWTQVGQAESAQSTSSCMSSVAYLQENASSMDPGNMAMAATEQWRAQTLAIPPVGGEQYSGTASISGSGSQVSSVLKGGKGSASISITGLLLAIGLAGMMAVASISGNGSQIAIGKKSISSTISISGNGSLNAIGEIGLEGYEGTASISGNGAILSEGNRNSLAPISISENGFISTAGKKSISSSISISANGSINSEGSKQAGFSLSITDNGSLIGDGLKGTESAILISDNGTIQGIGEKQGFVDLIISGNGSLEVSGTQEVAEECFGSASISGNGEQEIIGDKQVFGILSVTGIGSLLVSGKKTGVHSIKVIIDLPEPEVIAKRTSLGAIRVTTKKEKIGCIQLFQGGVKYFKGWNKKMARTIISTTSPLAVKHFNAGAKKKGKFRF